MSSFVNIDINKKQILDSLKANNFSYLNSEILSMELQYMKQLKTGDYLALAAGVYTSENTLAQKVSNMVDLKNLNILENIATDKKSSFDRKINENITLNDLKSIYERCIYYTNSNGQRVLKYEKMLKPFTFKLYESGETVFSKLNLPIVPQWDELLIVLKRVEKKNVLKRFLDIVKLALLAELEVRFIDNTECTIENNKNLLIDLYGVYKSIGLLDTTEAIALYNAIHAESKITILQSAYESDEKGYKLPLRQFSTYMLHVLIKSEYYKDGFERSKKITKNRISIINANNEISEEEKQKEIKRVLGYSKSYLYALSMSNNGTRLRKDIITNHLKWSGVQIFDIDLKAEPRIQQLKIEAENEKNEKERSKKELFLSKLINKIKTFVHYNLRASSMYIGCGLSGGGNGLHIYTQVSTFANMQKTEVEAESFSKIMFEENYAILHSRILSILSNVTLKDGYKLDINEKVIDSHAVNIKQLLVISPKGEFLFNKNFKNISQITQYDVESISNKKIRQRVIQTINSEFLKNTYPQLFGVQPKEKSSIVKKLNTQSVTEIIDIDKSYICKIFEANGILSATFKDNIKQVDINSYIDGTYYKTPYDVRWRVVNGLVYILKGLKIEAKQDEIADLVIYILNDKTSRKDEIMAFVSTAFNKTDITKLAIRVLQDANIYKINDETKNEILEEDTHIFVETLKNSEYIKKKYTSIEKHLGANNNEYLGDYAVQLKKAYEYGKINYVNAGPGTGKTEYAKKLSLQSSNRICIVVPYISMVESKFPISQYGKTHKFTHLYGDILFEKVRNAQNIVMTFDKFSQNMTNDNFSAFSHIIIDETHLLFTETYRLEAIAGVVKNTLDYFIINKKEIDTLKRYKEAFSRTEGDEEQESDEMLAASTDIDLPYIIWLTGTPTSEQIYFEEVASQMSIKDDILYNMFNPIIFKKETQRQELQIVFVQDTEIVETMLVAQAVKALKSKSIVFIPTNKGTEFAQKITEKIEMATKREIKSVYYKKSNADVTEVVNITQNGNVDSVDIVFASTYMSVGLDIFTDKKITSIYKDGEYTAEEIHQYNNRFRNSKVLTKFITPLLKNDKIDIQRTTGDCNYEISAEDTLDEMNSAAERASKKDFIYKNYKRHSIALDHKFENFTTFDTETGMHIVVSERVDISVLEKLYKKHATKVGIVKAKMKNVYNYNVTYDDWTLKHRKVKISKLQKTINTAKKAIKDNIEQVKTASLLKVLDSFVENTDNAKLLTSNSTQTVFVRAVNDIKDVSVDASITETAGGRNYNGLYINVLAESKDFIESITSDIRTTFLAYKPETARNIFYSFIDSKTGKVNKKGVSRFAKRIKLYHSIFFDYAVKQDLEMYKDVFKMFLSNDKKMLKDELFTMVRPYSIALWETLKGTVNETHIDNITENYIKNIKDTFEMRTKKEYYILGEYTLPKFDSETATAKDKFMVYMLDAAESNGMEEIIITEKNNNLFVNVHEKEIDKKKEITYNLDIAPTRSLNTQLMNVLQVETNEFIELNNEFEEDVYTMQKSVYNNLKEAFAETISEDIKEVVEEILEVTFDDFITNVEKKVKSKVIMFDPTINKFLESVVKKAEKINEKIENEISKLDIHSWLLE